MSTSTRVNADGGQGHVSAEFVKEDGSKSSPGDKQVSSVENLSPITSLSLSAHSSSLKELPASATGSGSGNPSPVHHHQHLHHFEESERSIALSQQEPSTSSSSAAAALIATKQKLLQNENLRRVMNPPKLERKHSSGDLHSRLKTRKILGVGETDNGDIHRSKISQVLGHNEHLYVKFPRGVWNWQGFLSALLLVQAVLILFFPRQACQLKLLGIHQQHEKEGLMIGSKYYAVSLLALSFILWRFMFIRDKKVCRNVQLAAFLHFSSLCLIDLFSAATTEISHLYDATLLTVMGVRMGTVLICGLYLSRIGTATSGLRKSPSHKDLGELSQKKDG